MGGYEITTRFVSSLSKFTGVILYMGMLNKDNYPNHGKFDGSLMEFSWDLMFFFLLFLVCQRAVCPIGP